MQDSWCRKLERKGKPPLSGAAAREARIKASGGMDNIVFSVASEAVKAALDKADILTGANVVDVDFKGRKSA